MMAKLNFSAVFSVTWSSRNHSKNAFLVLKKHFLLLSQ